MYLMLTWLKCSFGTQTTGGGGIFFAIFLSFMTAHDTNHNDELSTLWIPGSRQHNEILVSMLNVRKLVVKFAIVKQLHKEWKAICRQRLLWIPASPEPVLWLAATRSDESTLGIFADSTTSNITTNFTFFGSFALLILEKSFYIAQVGGWYLFYGTSLSKFWKKIRHFHAIHFIDIACE